MGDAVMSGFGVSSLCSDRSCLIKNSISKRDKYS